MAELISPPYTAAVYALDENIVRKDDVEEEEAFITKELSELFPEFVVKYYDYKSKSLYMEYVHSIEIEDSEHLLLIAWSLLSSIRDIHKAGYLHRDIHRENMGILENGIKLYDFGSLCTREECNLYIIGHYSTEDYEELGEKMEPDSEALATLIESNDYYAVGCTIDDLRRGNEIDLTPELRSFINVLTNEDISAEERIIRVNSLFPKS